MPSAELFEAQRRRLFAIAYRMLGSVAEAEDAVQEVFLRWERAPDGEVRSAQAYLTTLVTRLCIDRLRSARAQRESYVGAWLPEPLLTEQSPEAGGAAALEETLSMAFLVLLESLNPVERAVFLLREVFEYDYPEVARIVGKSEANCRQIARRAREYVASRRPRFEASAERKEQLVRRFAQACGSGDLPGLIALLDQDITLWADGGGKAIAALNPIHGGESVARFLLGVLRKFGGGRVVYPAELNGQPGFLSYEEGRVVAATLLDVGEGRILGIRIIRNPDKLASVQRVVDGGCLSD